MQLQNRVSISDRFDPRSGLLSPRETSEPPTAISCAGLRRAQIQLYGDVPVGSARFADLARGVEGVGYRRSKIDFVSPVCGLAARLGFSHTRGSLPS